MNIYDAVLKQQHRVEGRSLALSDEILEALHNAQADIIGRLTRLRVKLLTASTWQEEGLQRRKAFLEAQKAEVDRIIQEIFTSIKPAALTAVADAMHYTSVQTASILDSSAVLFGVGSPKLDMAVVQAWAESSIVEGRTMTEWLSRMAASSADRITLAGRQAMVQGMTVPQTARLLRQQIEGCRPQIEGIARTFLLSASNHAREEVVERVAQVDFKWLYCATLDGRCCMVCGADDKKLFARDKPRPTLPRHPNCRCVYVPRTQSWQQLGGKEAAELDRLPDRAATKESGRTVHHRDGSTSTKFEVESVEFTDESYSQWITRQAHDDPAFARQVLGKTRFELLRDGKITLEKMIIDGRIKKLSELL